MYNRLVISYPVGAPGSVWATQQRFQLWAEEFETLVADVGESEDPEQRKQPLRRMKILIDEIDWLVLSS